jgi:hypothetical protein
MERADIQAKVELELLLKKWLKPLRPPRGNFLKSV